jgi:hypothetical protein
MDLKTHEDWITRIAALRAAARSDPHLLLVDQRCQRDIQPGSGSPISQGEVRQSVRGNWLLCCAILNPRVVERKEGLSNVPEPYTSWLEDLNIVIAGDRLSVEAFVPGCTYERLGIVNQLPEWRSVQHPTPG